MRLTNGQVPHLRLLPGQLRLEPATSAAGLPIGIHNEWAIAYQATAHGGFAIGIDRRQRMARRQRDQPFPIENKNAPTPTISAPAPRCTKVAKAVSISWSLLASIIMSCSPIACATACTSLRSASVSTLPGFTSMAISVALGTNWRNKSSRFAPKPVTKKVTPVILPPGRLRLVTRPSLTGSLPVAKMMGSVVSYCLGREHRVEIADDHGHRPADQIGH